MASGTHKTTPRERIRAWLREARAAAPLPESIGAPQRPGIFVLLFWSALAAALTTWAFDLFGEGRRFGLVPVSMTAAVLIVAWLLLPWDPRTDTRRKLLALSFFLAAAFALCQTTNILWSLPPYSIAVADGVFVFGFGRGTVLATSTLPLAFATGYVYLAQNVRFAGAAFLAGIMVPVAAFVVGICKTVVEAERSRQEARALLQELEHANAELRRQAGKVRELAISEERARIAREVHDSVGHHLTAINLQLCGNSLSPASHWRQSYSFRQYSVSCFRYPSGTPRLHPTPGISLAHRVRPSRSARSSRSAWGISIRNGRISWSRGSVMWRLLSP
jgi:signal transduction histidine kinase